MLILQKDYITIDLERPLETNFSDGGSQSTGTNMAKLHFTVQCNGKIKRHTTQFYIEQYSEPMGVNSQEVSKYIAPSNYSNITEAIEIFNSLGYELNFNEISSEIYNILNK